MLFCISVAHCFFFFSLSGSPLDNIQPYLFIDIWFLFSFCLLYKASMNIHV